MIFDRTFLRSRVARRIVILFLICCLLPIGAIGVLGYIQVSREVRSQNEDRLQVDVKAVSQSAMERLLFLSANLEMLATRLDGEGEGIEEAAEEATRQFQEEWRRYFRGITIVREGRPPHSVMGAPSFLPELGQPATAAVDRGETAVVSAPGDPQTPSHVFLVTTVGPGDSGRVQLWGEVGQGYLWGVEELASTLPPGTQLCVLEAAGLGQIFCPGTNIFAAQVLIDAGGGGRLPQSGLYRFQDDERRDYLAAHWWLYLAPTHSSPGFRFILSKQESEILRAFDRFQRTFPLLVSLSLTVALLLSYVQVHRSLDPLTKLREGTRRIAERHFDSRVQISSGDEFEDLATSFNSMAARLGKQFSALTAMSEIDRAILSALKTEVIIETVVARIGDVAPSDGINVTLLDPQDPGAATSHAASGRIRGPKTVKEITIPELDMKELEENPELLRLDGGVARRAYLDFPSVDGGDLTSFLVLPIIAGDSLAGIVSLGFRVLPELSDDDISHVRQLADQMGVALSNARLIDELDRLNWGALIALARAIDAKSPWTAGHSERVTALACEMGRLLGLSEEEIDTLTRGGLLHDVGKIGTPVTILDKPGRLTPEEVKIMRDHVRIGAQILEPVKPLAEAIPLVLQHHERWDGKGYPKGLAGDEINWLAQILSVADAFDAMQSNRPYRKGRDWNQAMQEIRAGSGTAYNPRAVEAFLEAITRKEILDIFEAAGRAADYLAAGVLRAGEGFRMPTSKPE